MRYEYRTFVINPPRLLEEQPQLTDHVVWRALHNTFSRGVDAAEVASAVATRLDDGRLRVAAWLSRGPGVAVAQSPCPYSAAFGHNVHQVAAAVERDGITYFFTGLTVQGGFVDNPNLRELAVRGAAERSFPELVAQQYRLDHDLHCEVDTHPATGTASHYFLDVAVTAAARSGLDGQDEDVRYASFDRHLGDRMRELADRDLPRPATGEPQEGRSDTDHAQPVRGVLLPITVPRGRCEGDDLGRDDSLVACALERTFPELRGAEYGFDYDLGEDSLQITLSAQPRWLPHREPTDAWEVSLAASENERAAAVESNLDDVIREALDGDRPTFPAAWSAFSR